MCLRDIIHYALISMFILVFIKVLETFLRTVWSMLTCSITRLLQIHLVCKTLIPPKCALLVMLACQKQPSEDGTVVRQGWIDMVSNNTHIGYDI